MDQKDYLINVLVQQRNAAQDQLAQAVAQANTRIAELDAELKTLKEKEK